MSYFDISTNSPTNLASFGNIIVITAVEVVGENFNDLLLPVRCTLNFPDGSMRQNYFHFGLYHNLHSKQLKTNVPFRLILANCPITTLFIDSPKRAATLRFYYEKVELTKIKIKSNISFAYIETLYAELYKKGRHVDIELPDAIKEQTIASLPSLIQFLASWARYTELGDLYFNIKSNQEGAYTEIIEQYHSFCAIILAWQRDIKNQNGESIKEILLDYTSRVFRKMMFVEPAKNATILLANVDHDRSKKGLLDSFYTIDKKFIGHPDELEFTITKILTGIRKINANNFSRNAGSILEDLKIIVFELMKNTDDWAKDDHLGRLLLPNIRGLYFKYHKNFRKNFVDYSEGNNGLATYFKHNLFKENKLGQIYFLEVSVFDSGPGFIKRFLGREYSQPNLVTSIDIIKQCLVKNSTSSIDVYKGKGKGLDRILSTIDKKGFLFIKTGNVAVYRDLVIDNHIPGATKDEIKLYDWNTCKSDKFTETMPVQGSLVSILYPIDPGEEEGGLNE